MFNNKSKSSATNDKKHPQALAVNNHNDSKHQRKNSAQKSPPLSPRNHSANTNTNVKEFYFGNTKTNTNTSMSTEKSPRQITIPKAQAPAAMSLSKPHNTSLHASAQVLPKVQIKPQQQASHQNIANFPTQSQQAPRYQITHFSNTSTIQPVNKKPEAPITQQPTRINSAQQVHSNPQHMKSANNLQQVFQNDVQRAHSKIAHKVPEPKQQSQLQNSASILNLIIKSDSAAHGKSNMNFDEPIFDPEPAPEETDTFSHTIVSY